MRNSACVTVRNHSCVQTEIDTVECITSTVCRVRTGTRLRTVCSALCGFSCFVSLRFDSKNRTTPKGGTQGPWEARPLTPGKTGPLTPGKTGPQTPGKTAPLTLGKTAPYPWEDSPPDPWEDSPRTSQKNTAPVKMREGPGPKKQGFRIFEVKVAPSSPRLSLHSILQNLPQKVRPLARREICYGRRNDCFTKHSQ